MSKGHLGSDADKYQKMKEFRWLTSNIAKAKTPEQERKWRTKMENWQRANPQYARELNAYIKEMFEKKINEMTPEQREAYAIKLEEELDRREKVMKEDDP